MPQFGGRPPYGAQRTLRQSTQGKKAIAKSRRSKGKDAQQEMDHAAMEKPPQNVNLPTSWRMRGCKSPVRTPKLPLLVKTPVVGLYVAVFVKNFNFREWRVLQIRCEAYNAFNHPSYNAIQRKCGPDWSSPDARPVLYSSFLGSFIQAVTAGLHVGPP